MRKLKSDKKLTKHKMVRFGQATSTASYHLNMCSAVKVGALLNVWPIMAGDGGI